MASLPETGSRLLRAAGVSIWLLSGIPAMFVLQDPARLITTGGVVWVCAFAVFGAAFWSVSGAIGRGIDRRASLGLLVLQSGAALLMFSTICTGLETLLLVLVAVEVGVLFRLRYTAPWIVGQTAVLAYCSTLHFDPTTAFFWTLVAFTMQVFSLLIGSFAGDQARARLELARANAELRATRELLAHASRTAERVRIARELHDLMGHDLTALSLNLEVAVHQSSPDAREPISRAQEITRRMLSDVRKVVSALRHEPAADLPHALAALAVGVSRPRIELRVPPGIDVRDPELAHVLVRAAQEIITNAIRHSGAGTLSIELSRLDRALELRARDDGCGVAGERTGNGLRGMRERVEEVGGTLVITTAPRRGFEVVVRVPVDGGGA